MITTIRIIALYAGQHRAAQHRQHAGTPDMAAYSTPSPPIKSLDFRGFDSSKLLVLKGGNSHSRRI